MKCTEAFALFLVVRFVSVFVVQTSYVPDEYWQSLEVAHNIAFGYGYLTWEWVKGIRSYFYPLILAIVYKFLELLRLDSAAAVIYIPRILQAILSAYSDLCFYQWSGKKKWSAFNIASAWFWFYVGSRTIVNTLETSLTTIALHWFPWVGKQKDNNNSFLWIVGALVFIRPTAAIHWLPLCLYHLFTSNEEITTLMFKRYLPIGTVCLLFFTLTDSVAHGSFVITSYQFLKENIFNNVAEFYGSLPWYWYLSSGFPAILGIQLLPFILATLIILKNRHMHPNELAILGCIVFTIAVYSCLTHKEFRFILPVLPMSLHISSGFLSRWSHKANRIMPPFCMMITRWSDHRRACFFLFPKILVRNLKLCYLEIRMFIWCIGCVILIGNFIPAIYLSTIHQRGTLDVMEPLREISHTNPTNTSLLFLMPCHSTPLYSHLHINVTTRFLTCEPNFSKAKNYIDEGSLFYANPSVWLRKNYPPNGTLPSHIISFDSVLPAISDILSRYKLTHRFFHTHIPLSERIGRYVVIHEKIF